MTGFGVACIPATPVLVARLQGAVGEPGRVHPFVGAAAALPSIIQGEIDATVVAVTVADFEQALCTIRLLIEVAPTHPVIAWCEMRALSTRQLLDVAQTGVTELVLREVDDGPFVLLQVLTAASQRSLARRVEERLSDHVPRRLRSLFRYALEHAHESLTVDAVAASFGVTRRTLSNRLAEQGFPRPRFFLTWCRLLIASSLLDDTGRSLESVALQLDFSSGHGLGILFRRYVGVGIEELRSRHVSTATENAFRLAIAGLTQPQSGPLASLPLTSSAN